MARRVVFLPGAAGAAAFWYGVGDRLPASWSKRYLRWSGLGHEPHDPAVSGFADLVRLVTAELVEPADLVAQSLGGIVAIAVAAARPTRIRRVVVVATSGGVEMSGIDVYDWRADYRNEYPDASGWITGELPDMTDVARSVAVPTLLLWGDADPISPPEVGLRLASLLPDAKLAVIRGGSHAMAAERPAEIAAHIQAHLA